MEPYSDGSQMNLALFESVIRAHEGTSYVRYRDSLHGFVTVGVGFNLDSPGAAEICQQAGLDFKAIYAGQALTGPQVEALFTICLNIAIQSAQQAVSNFDALPDIAQAVVVDMAFNMGLPRFIQFQRFITALENLNYPLAVAEMKNSLWCRELPARCADDCAKMLEAVNAA